MSRIERVGDLEIGQDLAFQERAWKAQRIWRAILCLLVLAALAGAFGPVGPLSSTYVGRPDAPLRLHYSRFARFTGPATLRMEVTPPPSSRQIQLWLSREYLDGIRIEQITPEPSGVVAGPDRLTYTFDHMETTVPLGIAFHVSMLTIGPLSGHAGIPGRSSVAFYQFVYP